MLASSHQKSYCKNISGVVARCLWKWLVWVPPKLAGSAIQMDRFYNTWACSWTTTPGPIKWDLGASRLWRMQSDLFQSQSYRVPKFICTLPAQPDIHLIVSDSHVQWLYEARANTVIKIFQICFFLLESYDIALSISIWHMPDRCTSGCQGSDDPWRKHICM